MFGSSSPEAALHALLSALETAGVGCTVVSMSDNDIQRVYANEPAARIFGLDVAGLMELPPMLPLAPGERERLDEMREDTRDEMRGTRALETMIVRADGAHVPVEVGVAAVPLDQRKAAFAFLRDLSGKVAMQSALRDSEERFRSVAEVCPDSITIVSGGQFAYANPAALRQLGLESFDQLAGVDPMSLTPPHQRELAMKVGERLARGELVSYEVHTVGFDGRDKVYDTSMTLAKLGGEPAVIAYSRDVTERDALQAELTTRDRLATVGMLAAGVAHELNNPLAAVAMQVRNIRNEAERLSLPTAITERLALVDEAAERMRAIIGDLLFMARPVDRPQAHIDVAQVLTSTIALVRAGGMHLPVTIEMDPLPPIQGFASKLGQVFFNVLRNASEAVTRKADGDGHEGHIHVRGMARDDVIEIVVKDSGPGIAPDVLGRVKQPFFTTKAEGAGLGLWISQSLMAEHGGSLEIASELGAGTVVTLRLPVASR